ncbi:sugar phosphate isomerase/epimerase [Nocardiopsis sp. Huas11]|uniref:sugar phosphate isomerase/epimerase family protein n=1 Tax=Nocardiopsis sp. Huas11 TaxID=2183912 RepID=UPI000F144735|nr:sugar phosphate isomerase/epimerase family protein [Nocardiopsis sp. Huas11]RKS09720.1 sugar phosphate isomerase/epimerase [Nocardiopsis sp. Huas11]
MSTASAESPAGLAAEQPVRAARPFRPALAGIGDEAAPDLGGQLAALARLRWNLLELRTVEGIPLAHMDDTAFARTAERIGEAGVGVVCVASKIGDWSRPATGDFAVDVHELDVLARRCALLGTRLVRVMSYPSGGLPGAEWGARVRTRLRELALRAEDAGLVLAHENCAGWAGEDAERMLDLVTGIDSPALRLLFDTGNGVAHGYAAPPMLRALIDHVVHVHVKDAVTAPDGTVGYVPAGTGQAGVVEVLRTLAEHGYDGALSIEPHVHLRPHEGSAAGQGDGADFVAHGHALERLVARVAELTDAPGPRGGAAG